MAFVARIAARGAAGAVVIALAGCGDGGTGPFIDAVQPSTAAAGDSVDILGRRFCGDGDGVAAGDGPCTRAPVGVVSFGAGDAVERAAVQAWTHERITVMVPQAEPGVTTVVVSVNGVASNEADFEITP